ncbi:hypothetical protein D3C74_468670 [compost metagenome]
MGASYNTGHPKIMTVVVVDIDNVINRAYFNTARNIPNSDFKSIESKISHGQLTLNVQYGSITITNTAGPNKTFNITIVTY